MTLKAIVEDYISKHPPCAKSELQEFASQKTLRDAVSKTGLAITENRKRFKHQRRIPLTVLENSRQNLLKNLPKIEKASSFEELYMIVSSTIGGIKGIGELTVYDTALRIGAKLGLEPDVVYLHAGTRQGARNLGLDTSQRTIPLSALPKELLRLKPHEIEDVLCIYEEFFSDLGDSGGKFPRGCFPRKSF